MTGKNYPKFGETVPVEKFHVSKLNVRFGIPFGDSEEDLLLIANLKSGNIIEPFIVKPENSGYGVIVGRRRFLAKKLNGAKEFVVGIDFLINDLSDVEAREASLIENLDALRKPMDPIARAQALNTIMTILDVSLRNVAKRLGLPKSNLSDWLQVLTLNLRLQRAMSNGQLTFSNGLGIAKLHLDEKKQDKLADILEAEGIEAVKKEIIRISGKKTRGVPKGIYEVTRVLWNKNDKDELKYYDILVNAAEEKKMEPPEYLKNLVRKNIDKISNGEF